MATRKPPSRYRRRVGPRQRVQRRDSQRGRTSDNEFGSHARTVVIIGAEGASRIVAGSHDRGRLGRAIAGSVSAVIADQASCPVDIVRPDVDGVATVAVGGMVTQD